MVYNWPITYQIIGKLFIVCSGLRQLQVSSPDLWRVYRFQYNACDTESDLRWGWFWVWD